MIQPTKHHSTSISQIKKTVWTFFGQDNIGLVRVVSCGCVHGMAGRVRVWWGLSGRVGQGWVKQTRAGDGSV